MSDNYGGSYVITVTMVDGTVHKASADSARAAEAICRSLESSDDVIRAEWY